MGGAGEVDEAVDAAGYLRLSTMDRYVRHMGNVLSKDFEIEAERLGLEISSPKIRETPSLLVRLARRPRVRSVLMRVYDQLFLMLS